MTTNTPGARRSLEGAAVDLALHEAAGRRAAAQTLLRGVPAGRQADVVRRAASLLAQAREDRVRYSGDVVDTTEGGRVVLKAPGGARTEMPPGSSVLLFPELRSGTWLREWNSLVELAARAAAGETSTEDRLRAALRAVRERFDHSEREQDQAAIVAVQRLSDPAERARLQYEATALYSLRVPGRDARDVVPGASGFSVSKALQAVEGEYSPEMAFLMRERRKSPDPDRLYVEAVRAETKAAGEFASAERFARTASQEIRPRFNALWRSGASAKEVDDAFSSLKFYSDSVLRFKEAGELAAREAGEKLGTLAALYPGRRPAPDVPTVAAPRAPSAEQARNQAYHDAMMNLSLMIPALLVATGPAAANRGPGTNVRVWGGASRAEAAAASAAVLRSATLRTARGGGLAAGAAAAKSASARAFLDQAMEAFAARFAALRQRAAATSRGVASEVRAAEALESKALQAQTKALQSARAEAAAALGLASESAESFQASRAAAEAARARALTSAGQAARATANAAATGSAEDARTARLLQAAAESARVEAVQSEALMAGRAEAVATAARAAAQAEGVAADAAGLARGGVPTVRGATGQTVVLPPGAIGDPTQGPRLLRLVDVAASADTGAGPLADRLTSALRAARTGGAGFTREEQVKAAVLAVHGASDRAGRTRLESEAARLLGLFDPSKKAPLTAAESEGTVIGQAVRAVDSGAGAAGRALGPGPATAMETAARENALLRMRAQGAAAAAGSPEQKVAAAMREMSKSSHLTAGEQFTAALESTARTADGATAQRLRSAASALEAGRPVDPSLLDLWRNSGGAPFRATPAVPSATIPAPISPPVSAPVPVSTSPSTVSPGTGLPTTEEASRLFAPTRSRPAALTPWTTLRTESETIQAARWQDVVQSNVRRHAGDPERLVFEAMRQMRGRPNLTPEEQFRAAVQAAYEVADEATRVRIRAEMTARSTGRAPGLNFPLLDLWRRAGGERLPTITAPGVPSPAAPVVPAPTLAPAPTGAAPRYTPFGVLPSPGALLDPMTAAAASLSPFGAGLPYGQNAPFGLTGALPSPSAGVSVAAAELRGILDRIFGAAA